MTKRMLSLAAFFLVLTLQAQIEEEAIFITGGLNFSSQDADMTIQDGFGGEFMVDAKVNDFNIVAGGGYMFTDQFGVGIRLGLQNSNLKSDAEDLGINQQQKANTFLIAPFARMYVEIDEPLYAIFDFSPGFGFGKNTIIQTIDMGNGPEDVESEQNFSIIDVNLSPGFSYFLSDNFSVELWYGYIGYAGTTMKMDDGMGGTSNISSGGFTFNADLSTLRLGITYVFNN